MRIEGLTQAQCDMLDTMWALDTAEEIYEYFKTLNHEEYIMAVTLQEILIQECEEEEKSDIQIMKDKYKEVFGKSPKGPKANNLDWLKSKIEAETSEDEKSETELLKEEFKKLLGKSPKGPKANDNDWLKSKIEEAKDPVPEDSSDEEEIPFLDIGINNSENCAIWDGSDNYTDCVTGLIVIEAENFSQSLNNVIVYKDKIYILDVFGKIFLLVVSNVHVSFINSFIGILSNKEPLEFPSPPLPPPEPVSTIISNVVSSPFVKVIVFKLTEAVVKSEPVS